jgi:hypothetical protein
VHARERKLICNLLMTEWRARKKTKCSEEVLTRAHIYGQACLTSLSPSIPLLALSCDFSF